MKKSVIIGLAGIALISTGLLLEEKYTLLKAGTSAPDFTTTSSTGDEIRLSDYRGKNFVILYFYPKDFTAGCTEQACAFRDASDTLKRCDAVIIGVSRDDASSHARFASQYNLPFILVSDPDKSLSRAYGAQWLGGLVPWVKRVTYVIDKQGIILVVLHHEFAMHQDVDDILTLLHSYHK